MSNPIKSSGFFKDTIQDGIVQGESGSNLQQEHPELYGRLLMANEKLENVGTLAVWLLMLFIVGLCVTIHMAWIDPLLGIPVENLQGWGVYILIALASFVIYCLYTELAEKIAYRSLKPGIMNYLAQQSLTIPWLVSQLANDSSLEEISDQLKKEPVSGL